MESVLESNLKLLSGLSLELNISPQYLFIRKSMNAKFKKIAKKYTSMTFEKYKGIGDAGSTADFRML